MMPTEIAAPPESPAPYPCRVNGLLVFAITQRAADEADAPPLAEEAPGTALRAVREYVRRDGFLTASLRALHQDLVKREQPDPRWQLAIPKPEAPYPELARIQILTLAPGDEPSDLEAVLRSDPDYIAYVHRPAIRYALGAQPGGAPFDPDDPMWGLAKCGFREVWQTMETGPVPKPAGIIDKGNDKEHPELTAVFAIREPDVTGQASDADHATAVAGIIAAIRDNTANERLVGCCSARLHLYNVWPGKTFDPCAYYRALWEVAKARLPVVNLSIGWICEDLTEQMHIQTCLQEGVVVVAAMGNLAPSTDPFYPAACCGVVAVGGVDASDGPVSSSSRGAHTWISAPGERILTIAGEQGYSDEAGTSFAAPFVTAAVWLARRYRCCLTVDQVREVLKESVAPDTVPKNKKKWSADVGHGRLDMCQMLHVLNRPEYQCSEHPHSPPGPESLTDPLGQDPTGAHPNAT
jgi:hypothetical protein